MKPLPEKKTCLITGATSGIGQAAASGLAGKGFNTIVVGRNRQKCKQVCKKIQKQTGNDDVSFLIADLSSLEEIRRMAEEFKRDYDRLDILVNNAGARYLQRLMTVDGYEMTFALNHLAYFILTQLLIDELRTAGNARIINVSSAAHKGVTIDFDNSSKVKPYMGKKVYRQSKLANLLFTYELARRLGTSTVTANALHPGSVFTNFSKNNGYVSWAKNALSSILARNIIGPKKAAETILYLATSPEVDGINGKYFFEKNEISSSQASYDEVSAERLWKFSEEMTKCWNIE